MQRALKPPAPPGLTMSQRHASSSESDEKFATKVEYVEETSATNVVVDEDGELLLPERRREAERRLVRKLDFRLLPTIVLIFILNYIDVGPVFTSALRRTTDSLACSGLLCRLPV